MFIYVIWFTFLSAFWTQNMTYDFRKEIALTMSDNMLLDKGLSQR